MKRNRWDWDAAVAKQTYWGKTTSELINNKRKEQARAHEVFVELFQKFGFTLQRWHYSDATGIVKLSNDVMKRDVREYHTYRDYDAFVYNVLRAALEQASDCEEFELSLESISLNDSEHDRSCLSEASEHVFALLEPERTNIECEDEHDNL